MHVYWKWNPSQCMILITLWPSRYDFNFHLLLCSLRKAIENKKIKPVIFSAKCANGFCMQNIFTQHILKNNQKKSRPNKQVLPAYLQPYSIMSWRKIKFYDFITLKTLKTIFKVNRTWPRIWNLFWKAKRWIN